MVASRRKLLVLDLNGLLVDTYSRGKPRPDRPHDGKVNRFYVYRRPFCKEFVQFCLDNFIVGVWSSAQEHNVHPLLEYLLNEAKQRLAFVWHQEHCTEAGFRHPDNRYKPVFLKELTKLWKKYEPDLPWQSGDYGPSNTLLIDDSAYKAILNPPHTTLIAKTYRATDPEDSYLDTELRIYLENLLQSTDVQAYLQENPIGEPSIAAGDPRWSRIFVSVSAENEGDRVVPGQIVETSLPESDTILSVDRQRTPVNLGGGDSRARRELLECTLWLCVYFVSLWALFMYVY